MINWRRTEYFFKIVRYCFFTAKQFKLNWRRTEYFFKIMRYCFFTAKQFKLIMEPLCDNLRRVNIAEVPTQIEGREEPRQAEEMSPSNIQGEAILKLMRNVYNK